MKKTQEVFQRYEKKYLLTRSQYEKLREAAGDRIVPDVFGRHTICNVYFDTESYELNPASIEKPPYKEKLRLRSYGTLQDDSQVFIELKKKYDGVVYKRRIPVSLSEAEAYLYEGMKPEKQSQIFREIDWFIRFYRPKPSVFLAYDRRAFFGKAQEDFRVTFDTGIRYREDHLHLSEGDAGILLIREDQVLMEVKMPDSMPCWFGEILSDLEIFPISFSKYGTYYRQNMNHLIGEGVLDA